MFRTLTAVVPALALAVLLAGCGDVGITDPTDVQLGETTFVFVLNPTVNDANQEDVPPPGPKQGSVDVSIQDGAAEMVNVRYAFGGEVIEIPPDMTLEDVNDALSESNVIVLVRGGTYTGDIKISGSGTVALGNAGMDPTPPLSGSC